MRPRDIEKIANGVMGVLGQPIRASAGCSGVSDPQPFTCVDDFTCGVSSYACGGAGAFACGDATPFYCEGSFNCAAGWDCTGVYTEPVG